jgi:hypothetical protein
VRGDRRFFLAACLPCRCRSIPFNAQNMDPSWLIAALNRLPSDGGIRRKKISLHAHYLFDTPNPKFLGMMQS